MGNKQKKEYPPARELPALHAQRLRGARARKKLTVRKVAALVGISAGYMSKLEYGLKLPSVVVARKLAEVLLDDRPEYGQALIDVSAVGVGHDSPYAKGDTATL